MDNYIGELRVFAFGRIPRNWAPCNGQSLRIDNNRDLFGLLGTTYGGDGVTTFNLPDLRGRAMLHFDDISYPRGLNGGAETVILVPANLPAHSHTFILVHGKGTDQLSPSTPGANYLAAKPQVPEVPTENIYAFTPDISGGSTTLHPDSVTPAGESQPHENRMPHLPMLICIALTGNFPREN